MQIFQFGLLQLATTTVFQIQTTAVLPKEPMVKAFTLISFENIKALLIFRNRDKPLWEYRKHGYKG